MNRIFFVLIMTFLCGCTGLNKNTHDSIIFPDNQDIHYTGRVEVSSGEAIFDWANTQIEFTVDAPEVELSLIDGNNDYNVFIDDELHQVLSTEAEITSYTVTLNEGIHRIKLTKRNGPNFGSARFLGLKFPSGGKLLTTPKSTTRKIEFIGDSYTVGYGNEGPAVDCGGVLRPFENSYMSFAAIAARNLDAESHSIAISGFGVVRNYGDSNSTSDKPFPIHYGLTLKSRNDLNWDFSRWTPDTVVIKLGANDHSTRPNPPEDIFIQGMHDLINQVHDAYGHIPVFLAADNGRSIVVSRIKSVTEQQKDMGNDNIHYVQLTAPDKSQLGCDAHPLVESHEIMAAELVNAIKPVLGW